MSQISKKEKKKLLKKKISIRNEPRITISGQLVSNTGVPIQPHILHIGLLHGAKPKIASNNLLINVDTDDDDPFRDF